MRSDESNPMPDTDAVPDSGTAGGDRSTTPCTETETVDPTLRLRLRVLMAERMRALAELELARASEAKAAVSACDAVRREQLQLIAEAATANAAEAFHRATGRLRGFMEHLPTANAEAREHMQRAVGAMCEGVGMAAFLLYPPASLGEFRRTSCEMLEALRRTSADVLRDQPPTASVRIDVAHDSIHVNAMLQMGATFTASRTWTRQPAGGWRSAESDFAEREAALPDELAEFIDRVDLPTRVADMLPRRRHGADIAQHAAAAKAIAEG